MPSWTAITTADVKTTKISIFLETIQALATARSESDPLPTLIADVVAKIRSAVAAGNALDSDTTKIPNSLQGLALRMIGRGVKGYCEVELSGDEKDERKADDSYFNRIIDAKLKFETPDDPAGSGEMQPTDKGTELVSSRERLTTREKMAGL